MASRNTYPCFACRKAGYEILVYLDGKDEQGRTKYLNEDGSKHVHKQQQQEQQQQQQQPQRQQQDTLLSTGQLMNLLATIDGKIIIEKAN